jgi:hypothetical protein
MFLDVTRCSLVAVSKVREEGIIFSVEFGAAGSAEL